MSKLKHTPGPWAWQEGDRYIRIHDEESGKGGYWNESQKIAETYYVNNSEETISNNLLISAAPEMLEALMFCFKEMHEEYTSDEGGLRPYQEKQYYAIKSIIEKAIGLTIEEILNEN